MSPVRVGLAGLGTVGAEVARFIKAHPQRFTLSAVSARTRAKDRGVDLSNVAWVDDPVALTARTDVDVVIELMGGANGAAYDLAQATIAAGKRLITANKAMLAAHWDALQPIKNGIGFEASVAGGIPVIDALKRGLAANKIGTISGILNGTCNYILTRMGREGMAYAAALKQAQELGYAESDPTFDVEGYDTAHKLYILARLAGANIALSDIAVRGISDVAADTVRDAFAAGGAVRLLATADLASGTFTVAPKVVAAGDPLASVDGPTNAVTITGDMMPSLTLIGAGAGAGPTASAVCADLLAV